MLRQPRRYYLLADAVTSEDARGARNRLLFLELGLIAVVGTGLFVYIDSHLGAARILPPCRAPEQTILPTPPFSRASSIHAVPSNSGRPSSIEFEGTPSETSIVARAAPSEDPKADYRHIADTPIAEQPAPAREHTDSAEPQITGALVSRSADRSQPGGVSGDASSLSHCPLPRLHVVLADISSRFGPVTVVATHQLRTANHQTGSIRQKLHESCKAVDFRPDPTRIQEITAYLRSQADIAGVESYRDGVVHIDIAGTKSSGRGRVSPGSSDIRGHSKLLPQR
jgi:Peptidase M15